MRGKLQRLFDKPSSCDLLTVLLVVAALTLGSGRPSLADFADGLSAYDAGDLQAAYDEWLPLAENGDLQAQVAVAGLLETGGPGFARNLPAGIAWYRRAAERGEPVAQMNLGEIYEQGRGVTSDLVKALAWFSLAAEQGRQWAAEQRDRLATAMTPSEIEAAKAQAGQLRATY